MVWPAPVSRSSGGRSAVQTSSGTRAWWASSTAGCSSAAAVPEVQTMTAGRPDALAAPRAKNDADRSSRITWTGIRPSWARARARGAERDPGLTAATHTPARHHSSTKVRASAAFKSPVATPLTRDSADGRAAPGVRLARAGPRRARARLHPDPRVLETPGRRPGRHVPGGAGRPAGAWGVGRGGAELCGGGGGDRRRRGHGHLCRLLDGRPAVPAPGPRPARSGPGPGPGRWVAGSGRPRRARRPPGGGRGAGRRDRAHRHHRVPRTLAEPAHVQLVHTDPRG